MSERVVPYWTKRVATAFPVTGSKGEAGEYFYAKTYFEKGYKVDWYPSDAEIQCSGADVILDDRYYIDVKNNLTTEKAIAVEHKPDGWLFNKVKVSEYIAHVNPELKIIATYTRKQMQQHVQEILKRKPYLLKSKLPYFYINYKDIPSFVKWQFV